MWMTKKDGQDRKSEVNRFRRSTTGVKDESNREVGSSRELFLTFSFSVRQFSLSLTAFLHGLATPIP